MEATYSINSVDPSFLTATFRYLNIKDLGQCASICKKWRSLSESDELWEEKFYTRYNKIIADHIANIKRISLRIFGSTYAKHIIQQCQEEPHKSLFTIRDMQKNAPVQDKDAVRMLIHRIEIMIACHNSNKAFTPCRDFGDFNSMKDHYRITDSLVH